MDAEWTVEQYRFANGHKPFDSFMRTLSDDALAEAFALRRRLGRQTYCGLQCRGRSGAGYSSFGG